MNSSPEATASRRQSGAAFHREPGLALTLLVFSLLGTVSACQRAGENQRVIAVIPKGTSHVFWQSIHAGALAAGRDFQVQVLWNGPSVETDFSRQIQIVDSMIARNVDGLAVSASDRTALNGALERAARARIPVTVFDSGVESTNYMTFLATNNPGPGPDVASQLLSSPVGMTRG